MSSLSNRQPQTPAQTLRGDSLPSVIGANAALKMTARTDRATVIQLIRLVMGKTGLSQKAMAANAAVPESVLSDALNPNGARNFAAEWLFDQESDFVLALFDEVMVARGLTRESRQQLLAQHIGQLVQKVIELAGAAA